MPPLSPTPGWTSGDVCRERTASERTRCRTLAGEFRFPFGHLHRFLGRFGPGDVAVLVPEGLVDPDQGLLLVLVDERITPDLRHEIRLPVAGIEDAGPDVERLGRDLEGPGQLLEDLR